MKDLSTWIRGGILPPGGSNFNRVCVKTLISFRLSGLFFGLASVLAFFSGFPLIQAQSGEIVPFVLPGSEEVIVTASRAEEEVAFVPSGVTVLTHQDIRNSPAMNIPELLRTAAGITVTDLTGGGRNYRVDLRGFGETAGSNLLVLVNGRRINQPDLSGVDWTQIPLSRVHRIEIVRGGRGGVLFGDNSTAGVVNILTKGGFDDRGRIELQGGSYSSLSLAGEYAGRSGALGYSLSGSIYDSNRYRENSHTRGREVGGNLDFQPHSRFGLNLSAGFHHDRTGMPGALTEADLASGVPHSGTVYPQDRIKVNDIYFQARPRFILGENSRIESDVSFRRRENVFYSSAYWGYFQGDTELRSLDASPRLVVDEDLAGKTNRLTAGMDISRNEEDIINSTSYSPQAIFALEKRNMGIFFHDEFFPVESLSISGGYRWDRVEFGFGPFLDETPTFRENLATAGISWQVHQNAHLFLEYGSGIRYPLLDELFDFYSSTINTGLEPQKSASSQAGLKLFLPNTFFINLSVYRLKTEGELFFNPQGGPYGFGANENFAGTNNRQGLEIETGMQLARLTLTGSFGFTGSKINDGIYAGSRVPGVPKHSAAIRGIYYFNPRFDLTLEGIFKGQRYFESDWSNDFPLQEDYFLLNSRIRYRLGDCILNLDLRNLLNQKYSQFGVLGGYPTQRAYYPSPRFNLMAGLTFNF